MIPQVFEVTAIGKGLLYVMPKPSSEWLADDVKYFQSLGINLVLSLLEISESYDLGLANEQHALESCGIEYSNFQIKDRGLPNGSEFKKLIFGLHELVSSGVNLAVHCRAGIGRTGVVATCLLIHDGYEPQAAIDLVSASRGVSIPDTQEQYDYIQDYDPVSAT